MQHAGLAASERGRMLARLEAMPGGLDAVDLDVGVVEERKEQPHGIRAAADAGDEQIGQPSFGLLHLHSHLLADHRLEVAHHHGIGVRARDRADAVEGVGNVADPVPQGLVHRVFERLRAGLDRPHGRAERLHAQHVGLLARNVNRAHVDDAFEPELGAHGRSRDAVHAGAGLGDDAWLAHPAGQHDLAEHVIHLVGAGVIEVLALEIDLGTAEMRSEALGKVQRRWPADIVSEIAVHLRAKGWIVFRLRVSLFELEDERHQRLGDEPAAILPEMPALIRTDAKGIRLALHRHEPLATLRSAALAALRAARTNARILSGSFSPGARSTPEDTSTAGAFVIRSASATLPASRPPDSMNGTPGSMPSRSRQSKLLPSPPGRVASRGARASNSTRSATLA